MHVKCAELCYNGLVINIDDYLSFAIDIARHAGKILMSSYGKSRLLQVVDKDEKGLVTKTDLDSDAYIKKRITEAYPTHALLTEESGATGENALQWVVDGLDGTNNHRRGDPNFSVSLGLRMYGKGILGVVYAPVLGCLYYAAKDKGAFVEEKGIKRHLQVSEKESLDMFTMSFAVGIDFANPEKYDRVVAAIRKTQGIRHFRRRMLESTALELCYVASGKTDAHFNNFAKPWDIAAGVVIVREAGGKITMLEDEILLASNGVIHNELIKQARSIG